MKRTNSGILFYAGQTWFNMKRVLQQGMKVGSLRQVNGARMLQQITGLNLFRKLIGLRMLQPIMIVNSPSAVNEAIKLRKIIGLSLLQRIMIVSLLMSGIMLTAQETLQPVDDSYVYLEGDKASIAYGVEKPEVLITRKSAASDQYTREAYVKFDISGMPDSFSSAEVRLYGQVVADKSVEVYSTSTGWNEETLTGVNRPVGSYIGVAQLTAGTGYFSWDVTQYLNQARAAGAELVSFNFKDLSGGVSTDDTDWHSKENNSGNAPRLVLTEGDPPEVYKGNYYVDMSGGNDANSGHSPGEAWKSLENVNNLMLTPGDSLLFKSGEEWIGTFSVKGSGVPGKPIVIGKYGGDVRPVIHGEGEATNTISLFNQEYVVVRDLGITNTGEGDDVMRRGLYYEAQDLGKVSYIVFDNLEVYDVYGTMEDKNNGGIFLDITGSLVPTWFDSLIVRNCYIHDVNRTGLSNRSYWDTRTPDDNMEWTPSTNVHIHHNNFERTGANALIVRASHKPIMEYNLFTHCSVIGTGNASFSFNTDSAIWQYNEACYTKYNEGDNDAGGFDSDYRSKWTIIQYNYSHHNGFSGILITGGPGSGSGFNDGTIIRYNVFADNGHHAFRISGNATNTTIHNNVIFNGKGNDDVTILWHKFWGGTTGENTNYYNNIIYNLAENASFDLELSKEYTFSNNIFYGNPIDGMPAGCPGFFDDPMLVDPENAGDGYDQVKKFMIRAQSAAQDQGKEIEGNVSEDIMGNPVPSGRASDIGVFERLSEDLSVTVVVEDESGNPAGGAKVELGGSDPHILDATGIYTFTGLACKDILPVIVTQSGYPKQLLGIDPNIKDTLYVELTKEQFSFTLNVKDMGGEAVPGAMVVLGGNDTLYSDNEGSVTFANVAATQQLFAAVSKEGFRDALIIEGLTGNATFDLVLKERWLEFHIMDESGNAVVGATVTLEKYGPAITNEEGLARFTQIASADTLEFEVLKEGHVPLEDRVIVYEQNVVSSQVLTPVTLNFYVSDATLEPLQGASVLFMDQLKYVDASGNVQFSYVPLEDSLEFSVYQSGYITYRGIACVEASGETIYVLLKKLALVDVLFTVTDFGSKGLANAVVSMTGYGSMVSDAGGKALFQEVETAEDILYEVSCEGYADTSGFITVTDQDLELQVRMRNLSGNAVSDLPGETRFQILPNPARDYAIINVFHAKGYIYICDLSGRLVYQSGIEGKVHRINLDGLVSGSYLVQYRDETGHIQQNGILQVVR